MGTRMYRGDQVGGGAETQARAISRRARLPINLAFVLAFCTLFLLLSVGTASAADDTTLIVNTVEDIVPSLPDTSSTPEDASLASCLHQTKREGTAGGTGDLSDLEGQVNEAGDDADAPDAKVVGPCSLRMALTAATAIAPSGPVSIVDTCPTTCPVTIEIAPTDAPDTDNGLGATLSLSPAEGPLPPVAGSDVTIDGCAMPVPQGRIGPCINLDLDGGVLDIAGGVAETVSTVPEGPPGLIALAEKTTIKGIAFWGGTGPAILTPPVPSTGGGLVPALPDSLTVTNSYFGLKTAGTPTDAPPVGIQLSGVNAQIGGTTPAERNIFSGGGNGSETGVLIAGGAQNTVQGNWFGPNNAAGRAPTSKKLENGVVVTSLGASAARIAEAVNHAAGRTVIPAGLDFQTLAKDNLIGGRRDDAGAAGTDCGNVCNVFVGTELYAIDVGGRPLSVTTNTAFGSDPVGAADTKIESNWIGVDATGAKGENGNSRESAGIVVRNGSRGTIVGGDSQSRFGNTISNTKGPGLLVEANEGTASAAIESGAGRETLFEKNVGSGNSKGMIDLGGDGAGNKANGPSGGIQEPSIGSAFANSVSGSAAPDTKIDVYFVPATPHSNGRGEIASHLGSATTNSSGAWTASVSAPAGSLVTATATGDDGTSELARNATVQALPEPQVEEPPPPLPPPPADVTPPTLTKVLGKDPEKGSVVVKKPPKELAGEAVDESGVAEVRVALQIVKLRSKKKGKKAKPKRCKFIDLKKGAVRKRRCDAPPYVGADLEASGAGVAWEVPLSKKARKRLRPGKYLIHVEVTDTTGNTETYQVPLKRK